MILEKINILISYIGLSIPFMIGEKYCLHRRTIRKHISWPHFEWITLYKRSCETSCINRWLQKFLLSFSLSHRKATAKQKKQKKMAKREMHRCFCAFFTYSQFDCANNVIDK